MENNCAFFQLFAPPWAINDGIGASDFDCGFLVDFDCGFLVDFDCCRFVYFCGFLAGCCFDGFPVALFYGFSALD